MTIPGISSTTMSQHPSTVDLTSRFTYHPPKPGQPEIYQTLRAKALEFAELVVASTPAHCRELDLALTNIEQAVMWANAGIARSGEPG